MPVGKGGVPHDLVHLVVEAHYRETDGFWGLLARGATFKRGTTRKPTRAGRELVRAHRRELHENEQRGNAHHGAWRDGRPTPVAPALDRLARLWRTVPPGGALMVSWPSLEAEALTSTSPPVRTRTAP